MLPLFLVLAWSGCAGLGFHPETTPNFQLTGSTEKYYVYVPKAWNAAQRWPVIMYLHGRGESGTDRVRPTQHGLGPVVWKSDGTFPAIVVFPQARWGSRWGMPENNSRVLAILDEVMARYQGDPNRVYLTGNSMGGYGAWFLAALYPDRFAAVVPICGGIRREPTRPDAPFAAVPPDERAMEIARRIGKLPVWIFQGAKDWLVPPRSSREMAAALRSNQGNVLYTEYPDLGHNSWDRAYSDPALFTWLFAQHR